MNTPTPSDGFPAAPQPPRKRHTARTVLLVTAAVVTLIVVLGVTLGGSSAGKPATAAPTASASTTSTDPNGIICSTLDDAGYCPGDDPVSNPATTAPAQPTPPPADQVIARFSGTSNGNTGSFTVPADGNWHLSYAYTNGSLFAGQAENFSVTEYGTDGTYDNLIVNDLAIGYGKPTAVPEYSDSDAGQQVYFQVSTEDASWSLVVLTGSS